VAAGTNQQLKATGILENSSSQDLTDVAAWTSSDTSVAAVVGQGLVSANALTAGASIIAATFSSVTGTTLLTSSVVRSIAVTPTDSAIAPGIVQQFTATGTLSNNAKQNITEFAAWSTVPPGIVAITGTGLGLSLAPGTAIITASLGEVQGSAVVTVAEASLVSIRISPGSPSIDVGVNQQFTAHGVFSDGATRDITSEVTWISSNTRVAIIGNAAGTKGLALSQAAGSTMISAVLNGISSDPVALTVIGAEDALVSLTIAPSDPLVRIGETLQFTVTAIFLNGSVIHNFSKEVTWRSSNSTVAFVSQGFTTTFGVGTTTITASSGGISASTVLTVTSF
jgi:hypothetical protein